MTTMLYSTHFSGFPVWGCFPRLVWREKSSMRRKLRPGFTGSTLVKHFRCGFLQYDCQCMRKVQKTRTTSGAVPTDPNVDRTLRLNCSHHHDVSGSFRFVNTMESVLID
jgi:hypothetical protein